MAWASLLASRRHHGGPGRPRFTGTV